MLFAIDACSLIFQLYSFDFIYLLQLFNYIVQYYVITKTLSFLNFFHYMQFSIIYALITKYNYY